MLVIILVISTLYTMYEIGVKNGRLQILKENDIRADLHDDKFDNILLETIETIG